MDRTEITRTSVADQAATLPRQHVLEGKFRPGTQFQELLLASSLGVSRCTMREGTRILSMDRLLRRNIHRSVPVAQLSLRDVHEIHQSGTTLQDFESRTGSDHAGANPDEEC